MLSMATKRQIIDKQKAKYRKSGKKDKGKILTALAETTGLTHGHLIRILSMRYEYRDKKVKSGRGRKPVYGITHKRLLAKNQVIKLKKLAGIIYKKRSLFRQHSFIRLRER